MQFYSVLGLEPRLALDPHDLEQRFYARSRELHPDRFVRARIADQQRALQESAILNTAYRTLKNPVGRAEYFLEQRDIRSKDLPPGFLEEAFELNMMVEEGGREEREKLRDRLSAIDGQLGEHFAKWDGTPDDASLRDIRLLLNQRRYIENLVNGHLSD